MLLASVSLVLTISFLISILTSIILIPLLRKFKINQEINKYLQERHANKKSTPTMGGLIFIFSSLITIFLVTKISLNLAIILIIFVGYALIGFIDDYLIIVKKNNKGLKPQSKLMFQIILAIIFFYLFLKADNEPLLWIHTIGFKLNIGALYGLFILFVLVSSSNAVNLTDGLDGLAAGLSVIAFLTFGIISLNTGWLDGYIGIAYFSFAVAGSLLGFLVFNSNPASIFMGDTGSLALGATLGTLAILTRHEIYLLVIGFVFVIETLSVIIQVTVYKLTKKRVFPMTPIHHTFEILGLKETGIVRLFYIVGLLSSLIAIIFLV
ncbi:MAG: phospho-N-acetylmuramoyl-pentapeptide-transferase [Bacilli bacterium]